MPYLLEHLTNQAIRSRDRFARAGTAVALGSLYSRAGSIVAGGLLRQVVVLLHSLASDKDPIVHTWAISALAEAAMSAGFMFEPHARDTFQMALKLFLSDSHAFPLYASAQWIRGKEHSSNTATDCASYERVLPLRSMIDPAAWAKQAAQKRPDGAKNRGVGSIVATSRDAAITHPNSTTHHGRSGDEQRDAMAAAGTGGEGDYQYVCARNDVDAYDARVAIGHLVSSLILVFGPELQVDNATRDSVTTLLRQLHRALPSVGVPVPAMGTGLQLSPIVDPDARWQTVAEFVFATQKQLLFFPPKQPEFLPLLVRQTLRPMLQTRRTTYYGYSSCVHSFQHVAVLALDSVLRLYGDRIFDSLESSQEYWADWAMDDIVWESLALHNTIREQISVSGTERDSTTLMNDLRKLVHSVISLIVDHDYQRLEALCAKTNVCFDETGEKAQAICNILDLVETLCSVFTKRAGAVPTLGSRRTRRKANSDSKAAKVDTTEPAVIDDVRPFNAETKKLAIAAIIAILDVIERARPTASSLNLPRGGRHWRSHPLISLLADLVRVGYMAATSPVAESATLCCLGLHLLQRLIAQFCDVEDPEMPGEGMPILAIYQAQLNSAFMPALSSAVVVDAGVAHRRPSILKQAAMGTAAAYVVSGLITDRGSLVRIVRLLAPQAVLRSSAPGTPGAKHRLDASNDPLGTSTPQMHIITKLSMLRTWSVILEHAVKTRSDSLLDIVQLHMPVLSTMWLDAVRDTAVIGVKPRDILDELGTLSQLSSTRVSKVAPDVGLGLSLGLESTYLGLVNKSLNVWYRYHLPLFLSSLSMLLSPAANGRGSHKVVSVLKSGYDELLGHLQNTLPICIPNISNLQLPSQSSVLLLGFVLQEISRLSELSLRTTFTELPPDDQIGNPLIQPIVNKLVVGALGIGGSDRSYQGDSESERIANLVQAGIAVFGPTSLTSNTGVKWTSDIRLLSSLLSALSALLQQSGDLKFAALFAATATADKAARMSWLVDDIWRQAVSIPLQPLFISTECGDGSLDEKDANPAAKQQCENRQMRVDVAAKALDAARSLLGCLRATKQHGSGHSGLALWLFDGSAGVEPDSCIGLLGLSGFGNSVLADMVGVWKFAQSQAVGAIEGGAGSMTLTSQSLAVIADILAEAISYKMTESGEFQKSVVSLWLRLWQKSVLAAGTPHVAFASLRDFVACVMDRCTADNEEPAGDILTGDSLDKSLGRSSAVQVITAEVNSMLLELLESTETDVSSRSLAVAAMLLAHDPSESGHIVVSSSVAAKFVSAFIAQLSSDALTSALDVPGHMAAPSKSTFVSSPAVQPYMPMLAKGAIPRLAAIVARNLPSPTDDSLVIDKALTALVMFAAYEYAEPRVSESVISTVLMLLLSMLPDNCSRLSLTQVKITESILSLAAASPASFKSILLKISATQLVAKRRLEAAIRSRAEHSQDSDENDEHVESSSSDVSGGATPALSADDKVVPSRIALKSDFAGF
ncbi:hypothetical protein EC988_002096 [Linderina pennispora]|nr:hypothetical protein EC988_002096 [Linderina pennispora]